MNRDDDCIYGDGPMTSKMKALLEENASLKADLLVYQNSAQYTASVTLHDPYSSLAPQDPASHIPPSPDRMQFETLTPFSPSSTLSSLPSGMPRPHLPAISTVTRPSASTSTGGGGGGPVSPQRSAVVGSYEEPPFHIVQQLLDTFLPHSSQFGFFLDASTFRDSTLLPLTLGNHQRPTPALVTTVLLWGAHLSHSDPSSQEHSLLMRALRYAATDMSGDHPQRIIHTLQAEVLLSYYFLRMSRFLEAKIHSTTAVTIALECGLNKIRSSTSSALPALHLVQDHPVVLHHAADKAEEGERINGFWSAFTLHKLITVMLQPSQNLCGILEIPGLQIDTPWPLDIESYSQEGLEADLIGNATLLNFLQENYTTTSNGRSTTAHFVKAAFLFHRSAYLASRFSPTFQHAEYRNYTVACTSVHNLINTLRSELPQPSQLDVSESVSRTILLTHALIDAAMIKLHTPFAYSAETSKQICIRSAQSIISFGQDNLHEISALNPVIGYLWMTACQVLVDEISRLRHSRSFYGQDLNPNEEHVLEDWYRKGLAALNCFTEDNPLMRYHMSKTQEAFNAI